MSKKLIEMASEIIQTQVSLTHYDGRRDRSISPACLHHSK